jgi:hypothetical protein
MTRRTDLEILIRQSYTLLTDYETLALVEIDPIRNAKASFEVGKQMDVLDGYLHEYEQICLNLKFEVPRDISEVMIYLKIKRETSPTSQQVHNKEVLKRVLALRNKQLLQVEEKIATFIDPRSVPADMEENKRLLTLEIKNLYARIKEIKSQ